jgi:hypothetical protein
MTARRDEINEFVDGVLKECNAEDTPQNRLTALEGLKAAWDEDEDDNIEKVFYMLALNGMIFQLKWNNLFPSLTG